MQLLPALTRDPEVVRREAPAGRHLPYARHVDDHTIETRDGLLFQVLHLRGLLFETADTEEINYRKRLRDAMLQSIGSSRFAIYNHVVRRRVNAHLPAGFPDSFSQQLDASWKARLAQKRLYVNDLFLTLVRRPLQGRIGLLDLGQVGDPHRSQVAQREQQHQGGELRAEISHVEHALGASRQAGESRKFAGQAAGGVVLLNHEMCSLRSVSDACSVQLIGC